MKTHKKQKKRQIKQKYKKYCNLPHKQKYTIAKSWDSSQSNWVKRSKLRGGGGGKFEVITISHHALLLTDFWGPSTLQLPFCLLPKWIGIFLLDLSSSLPRSWGPGTQLTPRVLQLWDSSGSCWPPRLRPKPAAGGVAGITADTKKTYCAIWPCQKLPELVFPSCFSHRSQLEKQNDAKHNIPWDSKTLEIADDLFSTRRTVGNQLYGTLTGYNPLLCFTFTSSGVRGVSSIETIEFEAMRHAQKA